MLEIINYNTAPVLQLRNATYPFALTNIATVAILRTTEPSYAGQVINLLGHTTAGIGGGNFRYDATDTTTADDDGIVIVTTTGGKRWKRILNGFIDSDMYNGNAKKVIENADTKHAIKLLADVTLTSTINVRSNTTIDNNGFKFNVGSSGLAPLNSAGSLTGSWTNLSSNMLVGTNTLTTTLSLAVGDWVFVRSEALYDDPVIDATVDDPAPVSKYGQIFQITSKSGDTYRTDYMSLHNFNTADTAQIRKINVIENVKIDELIISEENYTNQFSIGYRNQYLVNSRIGNLVFYGSKTKYGADVAGRSALKFLDCVNVTVDNIKCYHIGWYGVEFGGANRNVVINNIYGHDCRHVVSFNWLEGYGKAIDCHVIRGTGDTTTLSVFDTHPNSAFDNCSFQDLLAQDSQNDSGIQLRCDIKVRNVECNNNFLDGIVGRGIGKQPTIINFKGKGNLRNGAYFPHYGAKLINPVCEDNASSAIYISSGEIHGGSAERNQYALRIANSVYDTSNPLILNNLTAPQSAGKQTVCIFFDSGYDRSRLVMNNNKLIGYGDFVLSCSSGTGDASYPTSNKNNQTSIHATGSETRGRVVFASAGSSVVTTTAFRSLVTLSGTRAGGQISNVILIPLSGTSNLTYRWTRTSTSSFTITVSEACTIEWIITGI